MQNYMECIEHFTYSWVPIPQTKPAMLAWAMKYRCSDLMQFHKAPTSCYVVTGMFAIAMLNYDVELVEEVMTSWKKLLIHFSRMFRNNRGSWHIQARKLKGCTY